MTRMQNIIMRIPSHIIEKAIFATAIEDPPAFLFSQKNCGLYIVSPNGEVGVIIEPSPRWKLCLLSQYLPETGILESESLCQIYGEAWDFCILKNAEIILMNKQEKIPIIINPEIFGDFSPSSYWGLVNTNELLQKIKGVEDPLEAGIDPDSIWIESKYNLCLFEDGRRDIASKEFCSIAQTIDGLQCFLEECADFYVRVVGSTDDVGIVIPIEHFRVTVMFGIT